MWIAEKEGRDVEQLIEEICRELGKGRDELEFDVQQKGFLGIFGKRVLVRARPKAPSEEELISFAREVASRIAHAISPEATVVARSDGGEIIVEVEGNGCGALIGRGGETLEAFEYIVARAVSKRARAKKVVRLDVAGYRRRHAERLRRMALEAARRVKRTGKRAVLPPLKASDRRIVHLTLKDDGEVETRSEGSGELKRVFVLPKRREGVSRETPHDTP